MATIVDTGKSSTIFEEKKRCTYEFFFTTPCSVNDDNADPKIYFNAASNLLGLLESPNMALSVLKDKPEFVRVYKTYLTVRSNFSNEYESLSNVEDWIEDEDVNESGMIQIDVGFLCLKIADEDMSVVVDMMESLFNRALIDDEPGATPLKITEVQVTVTKTDWTTKFYTVS